MIFDRKSKADTVFLADIATSTLPTDLSQYQVNLTDNTTYLTSTAARLKLRSPRELAVVVDINNAHTGIIMQHGATTGVAPTWRISASAGSIAFVQGVTTLATIALPSVGAIAATYLIHWSTTYDEVAGTWASEFALCRTASAAWAIERVTHAQPPAAAVGDQLNVIGYGAGVTPFTGGIGNIRQIRLGARWHTTIEAQEDWVAESAAPVVTGYQPQVELAPVAVGDFYAVDQTDEVADAVLDEGTYAGPAEWLAALHAGESRQRLYSPLLNVKMNAPPTLQDTYLPSNWHRVEPNSFFGLHRYSVAHLWLCPVPRSVNGHVFARVRVHVQVWIAAGAPFGTTALLSMRAVSNKTVAPQSITGHPVATCTTNHTSTGVGEWVAFAEFPLIVGDRRTYIMLGYWFGDVLDTGVTYRRAKIKAINVEIFTKD